MLVRMDTGPFSLPDRTSNIYRSRDAITPNQDWVISPHPHVPDLYIIGGGSFHAWKFLPNIGKYVVQMINGELREEMMKRWAWDRSDEGGNCITYLPSRDLKDIPGYL